MIFLDSIADGGGFIDTIISALETYISIPFILSTNIVTYGAIKVGEKLDKHKVYTTKEKRLVVLAVTIVLFALFYFFKVSNLEVLFLSALLSPLTYSFAIKKLFSVLGITIYRQEDTDIIN